MFKRRKKRKYTSIYEIKAGTGKNAYYYIGKSNRPHYRLGIHKKRALEDSGVNKKKNKVFRQNITKLQLRIIERPKMKDWRRREIHWIAKYRRKYGRHRVLNMSAGGDGASGGGHDDSKPATSPIVTAISVLFASIFFCICLYFVVHLS